MRQQKCERQYGAASWCAAAAVFVLSLALLSAWAGEARGEGDDKGLFAAIAAIRMTIEQVTEKLNAGNATLRELSNDLFQNEDVREAREKAFASIGATRSLDPAAEITLPGAIGTVPQAVDRDRPLLLHWYGGAPPFRIELALVSAGGTRGPVIETSESNQRLKLSSDTLGGDYTLTIAGRNDARLSIPLRLVAATDVPVPPGIEAADNEEVRELVEAVWLLTRAPITWRLEALSRLDFLARDLNNRVAQAIVDPATSADGQKNR